MLEQFTLATFAERVGEKFQVDDGSQVIEMQLVAATAATLRSGERATTPSGRDPFSIVFRGPLEPILPQRIYPFRHETLGSFELFIVPIGPNGDAMQYEAVFA